MPHFILKLQIKQHTLADSRSNFVSEFFLQQRFFPDSETGKM